ncbi:MucR family transcriptional regulator [Rhizobium sp. SG570]|uniref:MucR family transcriptional regulator n=1 Tax=Rhizobium sp. SG570 TaxID=2587113 RepID=UPI0017E4C872|nr:putative transcriptional regulator [Rhizobium sp. SG570]
MKINAVTDGGIDAPSTVSLKGFGAANARIAVLPIEWSNGVKRRRTVADEMSKSKRGQHAESMQTLTAKIVCAYVTKNFIRPEVLPRFISSVYQAIDIARKKSISGNGSTDVRGALRPAVPITLSITPDAIFCLEDGKKFKSMRRHLTVCYNMTPDEYRKKWGLPPDYPMVASDYSERRSKLAKKARLGRRKRELAL